MLKSVECRTYIYSMVFIIKHNVAQEHRNMFFFMEGYDIMYKLYGYIPELKLIKTDNNEEKIIDSLAKLIHKVERIQFMIVSMTEQGPYVRTILSDRDFMDYIQEYVKNNKPLTRRLKK